jgi:hypothetical protein
MANNQNNPNSFQLPQAGPSKRSPQQVVSEIVAYIKAGITLTFWLILAGAMLGTAYVALQAILWAVNVTLRAVGL